MLKRLPIERRNPTSVFRISHNTHQDTNQPPEKTKIDPNSHMTTTAAASRTDNLSPWRVMAFSLPMMSTNCGSEDRTKPVDPSTLSHGHPVAMEYNHGPVVDLAELFLIAIAPFWLSAAQVATVDLDWHS
jgi:hypothetical protein